VDRPNSLPGPPGSNNPVFEHARQEYFSVGEIAERLGCSRDTVLRRFANEPGVIDLAQGSSRKRMLRIPLAVLNRVLAESSVT